MDRDHRKLHVALAGAALSLLAPLSARATDVVQATTGSRGLVVRNETARAVVLHSKGEAVIRILPGTRLQSIVEVADGYFVAGTRGAGTGSNLLVLKGNDAFAGTQPAPGDAKGHFRDEPVLLAKGQELAGMVWLEGDERGAYAVMAADWEKTQWGMVREVAPRGPGSQVGLTAAVLADGSWLVAWAGYDSKDDEIWWTRIVDGVPSKPARVVAADNDVPDVTPALVPAGNGAILAWSRYDGNDYRLALATFADGAFHEKEIESGKGSTEPSFVEVDGAPVLVYHSVKPEGFNLLKLDATGKVLAHASFEGRPVTPRPGVRAEGTGLALRFEGAESVKGTWSVSK